MSGSRFEGLGGWGLLLQFRALVWGLELLLVVRGLGVLGFLVHFLGLGFRVLGFCSILRGV